MRAPSLGIAFAVACALWLQSRGGSVRVPLILYWFFGFRRPILVIWPVFSFGVQFW